MRKNGKIPPHFLYFLENECIEVTDFHSGTLSSIGRDSYDRMVVKFPYSIKTLEIQVIFDNLDYSIPPDFVLTKDEKIYIDYKQVTKEWVFKESSSLYNALNKIKEFYSLHQHKRLKEETSKALGNSNNNYNDSNDLGNTNIFTYINKLYDRIKSRFSTYKNIPKSLCYIDVIINYDSKQNSSNNQDDRYNNHIIISYCADLYIRSRNINRAPIINIYIPITYDMKFYMDVKTPYFVSINDFKVPNDYYNLSEASEVIQMFENSLIEHFRLMQLREVFVNKVIEANIGFPLEVDTYSFSKFTLYFNYNKNNMNVIANSSLKKINPGGNGNNNITPAFNTGTDTGNEKKNSNSNNVAINNTALQQQNIASQVAHNFLLHFAFKNKEVELQIINSDLLRMMFKKKFDNYSTEKEISKILNVVLYSINDVIQGVKK